MDRFTILKSIALLNFRAVEMRQEFPFRALIADTCLRFDQIQKTRSRFLERFFVENLDRFRKVLRHSTPFQQSAGPFKNR